MQGSKKTLTYASTSKQNNWAYEIRTTTKAQRRRRWWWIW